MKNIFFIFLLLFSINHSSLMADHDKEFLPQEQSYAPAVIPEHFLTVQEEKDEQVIWLLSTTLLIFLFFLILFFLVNKFISDKLITKNLHTFRFKFTITIVIGVLISAVLLLSYLTIKNNKKHFSHSTKNDLTFVLDNAKLRIDIWIKNHTDFLFQLGRDPKLYELVNELIRWRENNNSNIKLKESSALSNIREFWINENKQLGSLGFFVIDKEFISIASQRDSNLGMVNLIFKHRPDLLKKAFKGIPIFIPPIPSDVNLQTNMIKKENEEPEYSMFFATPIQNKEGKVIAVLAQRLNPENDFSHILQSANIGESGESYIFNKNANILSNIRFYDQLVSIGLLKKDEKSYQKLKLKDPGGNMLEGFRPTLSVKELPLTKMAQSALSLKQVSNERYSKLYTDVNGYRDYRGVTVFGAWIWNYDLSFGIVTEIDQDEALGKFYLLRQDILIITFVTLSLSIMVIILLISLSNKINQRIITSNQKLNNLLHIFDSHVLTSKTDVKGHITYASKAFCNISGYTQKELLGHPHNMVRHPDMKKEVFEGMWKTIQSGKVWKGEVKNLKKDGGFYWVDTLIEPDFDKVGNIVGYSAIRHDITSNKKVIAQKEKIQSQDNMILQQSKVAAVGEMIGNIAHQWRQPLTTISANTANMRASIELEEELTNEEILKTIETIDNQSQYLSTTIEDFRNFFKANSRNVEAFDIKEALEKAIDLVRDSFKNNHIEIHIDTESILYKSNKNTFIQSTINILNNTKDAFVINNISTESRYIFISASRNKDEVVICFKDSAGGIKENVLNKVFDPYFTTKHESQGTGLGLYMTYQIITKHLKGRILAKNSEYEYMGEKLKGANFTMTIPILD